MKDEGISINGLAQAIRVPANRISLIVNEKRGITADTAARLGRCFGTSAQYWLNIQNRFDLDSIDQAAIVRDVFQRRQLEWRMIAFAGLSCTAAHTGHRRHWNWVNSTRKRCHERGGGETCVTEHYIGSLESDLRPF